MDLREDEIPAAKAAGAERRFQAQEAEQEKRLVIIEAKKVHGIHDGSDYGKDSPLGDMRVKGQMRTYSLKGSGSGMNLEDKSCRGSTLSNEGGWPEQFAEMRRQAEVLLRARIAQSQTNRASLSAEEALRALHELSVHQIELEMQNEEFQAALAEVETGRERYLELYDLAPVGYVTVSESGSILEANLTAAGMLGAVRDTLISQPFTQFVFPEDQDLHYRHRKRLFATGERQVWDLRMLQKDGTPFWVHMQAVIARDVDGAPRCRLVMSEITERKMAEEVRSQSEDRFRLEESLRESRRQLRTLIDTLPDLVWLKDPQGVYLACNHRFELFFGAKEQKIIGKTDFDFVDEGLAKFFREKDQIAMTAGKPTINEERITFACDGHQEDLETIKTPFFDSDGRLSGILGIGRNITLRKQAENSLRESEAQFRRYVEQSPIGIFECDRKGRYLQVNPAASRITGYTP